jgi:hypothetical protein
MARGPLMQVVKSVEVVVADYDTPDEAVRAFWADINLNAIVEGQASSPAGAVFRVRFAAECEVAFLVARATNQARQWAMVDTIVRERKRP